MDIEAHFLLITKMVEQMGVEAGKLGHTMGQLSLTDDDRITAYCPNCKFQVCFYPFDLEPAIFFLPWPNNCGETEERPASVKRVDPRPLSPKEKRAVIRSTANIQIHGIISGDELADRQHDEIFNHKTRERERRLRKKEISNLRAKLLRRVVRYLNRQNQSS